MDPGRQARLHDLFGEALERAPEDRAAFLDSACGGDADLRIAVESLLAAHERAGRFLADPTVPIDRVPPVPDELRKIGPYVLRRVIGEGGYGTVYLADQELPLRRTVAVKVIRAGMDTRLTIARFELERTALAMMDHPNIARVFDAGTTPAGRPYFVMELVDGKPVTDYCRDRKLDISGRLSIFRDVCAAVQHAHQKGIIHRDLKPSNVLVTEQDGRPVPKVIDFGIAKAIGAGEKSEPASSLTQGPAVLGTPQYMSPEQVGDDPRDIDTRADVYALGAMLYELLTGTPPFEPATLRGSSDAEVRRLVREVDPPRPSTRLQSIAAKAAKSHRIRRELDWVVMKAIEKDRARRYATVEALAADIRRCENHEPVTAGPPTAIYRLCTFARRHRRLVVLASITITSLAVGVAVATTGLVRARAARDRAVAAEQRETAQRHTAEEQRARAEAAAARLFSAQQFLYLLVEPPDDGIAAPPPSVLDYLSRRADDGLMSDRPDVLATLHLALGAAYARLGDAGQAAAHFSKYLGLIPPGATDVNTASALHNLGCAMLAENRYADALPLFQQSLKMYRAMNHGNDSIEDAPVLEHLGVATGNQGDLASAEPLLREALDFYVTANDRRRQWPVMEELAQVLDLKRDHPAATELWDQAKAIRQALDGADSTRPSR